MKEKAQVIQDKINNIKQDLNKVLKKHGLEDMFVHEITFSGNHGCTPGSHEVCQYLGKDPMGNPMYRCVCVPDN